MKPINLAEIQNAFSAQAAKFDSGDYHLTKQDYLDYIVEKTAPSKSDKVLEVAAGTCICGRALAPFAGHIICLDATSDMLAVGKNESEKAGITNLTQVKGSGAYPGALLPHG